LLLKALLEEGTRQANVIACFLSLALKTNLGGQGMLVGKALGLIEGKVLTTFENSKSLAKEFKQTSLAGLNTIMCVFLWGKDLQKAGKHASDAHGSFEMLNSATGQLESLMCMYGCDQAINSPFNMTVSERANMRTIEARGEIDSCTLTNDIAPLHSLRSLFYVQFGAGGQEH